MAGAIFFEPFLFPAQKNEQPPARPAPAQRRACGTAAPAREFRVTVVRRTRTSCLSGGRAQRTERRPGGHT
jgi:hypothetical protein